MATKNKVVELAISRSNGEVAEEMLPAQLLLKKIPKDAGHSEVNIKLVVPADKAETIFNSLSSGKVYVEVTGAKV